MGPRGRAHGVGRGGGGGEPVPSLLHHTLGTQDPGSPCPEDPKTTSGLKLVSSEIHPLRTDHTTGCPALGSSPGGGVVWPKFACAG